jgi:hypothetical protein
MISLTIATYFAFTKMPPVSRQGTYGKVLSNLKVL